MSTFSQRKKKMLCGSENVMGEACGMRHEASGRQSTCPTVYVCDESLRLLDAIETMQG